MALICMRCGSKQYDETAIRSYKKQYPGLPEDEIPYKCDACQRTFFSETGCVDDLNVIEIHFSDFTPETQKRLLRGYKISDPKEVNWDVFPVFTLYPDLISFEDDEDDHEYVNHADDIDFPEW